MLLWCYAFTHWCLNKMDHIWQTTYSNTFARMFGILIQFHRVLFIRLWLTTSQFLVRLWLGTEQATRHGPNQWWLGSITPIDADFNVLSESIVVVQISQCTSFKSHNARICNRNVHMWDIFLMNCGICEKYLICHMFHASYICIVIHSPATVQWGRSC